jgi:hypothetical protein
MEATALRGSSPLLASNLREPGSESEAVVLHESLSDSPLYLIGQFHLRASLFAFRSWCGLAIVGIARGRSDDAAKQGKESARTDS